MPCDACNRLLSALRAVSYLRRRCVRVSAGIIIYFRKEGRALGEVTKYLVYNRRKRQEGGDTAAEYFNCTQHVAGVMDMRFQVCAAARACMVACLHPRVCTAPVVIAASLAASLRRH